MSEITAAVSHSWCCPIFADHYKQAGERGLATIVVESSQQRPRFILQFRAVARRDEDLVQSTVPLSFLTEHDISFCPWCGRKLARWYRKRWRGLVREEVSFINEPT